MLISISSCDDHQPGVMPTSYFQQFLGLIHYLANLIELSWTEMRVKIFYFLDVINISDGNNQMEL